MVGALIFQLTMDISFVDAIYFTVVSASTVGYGRTPSHPMQHFNLLSFMFRRAVLLAFQDPFDPAVYFLC